MLDCMKTIMKQKKKMRQGRGEAVEGISKHLGTLQQRIKKAEIIKIKTRSWILGFYYTKKRPQ